MAIRRFVFKNFLGIRRLERTVGPAGFVAEGGNARGKTSVLKGLKAVLSGVGIGPEDIHHGADEAELFVDLGAVTARRRITDKGSTLEVRTAEGDRKAKPAAHLAELLGTALLDPLDFFLAKAPVRRAMVLQALPLKVTLPQLQKWAPDWNVEPPAGKHGLEVLAEVRKHFYEKRTAANKAEEEARAEAARKQKDAEAKGAGLPAGNADVELAAKAELLAVDAVRRLEAEDNAARAAEERSGTARAKVTAAHARAVELRKEADAVVPLDGEPARAEADCAAMDAHLAELVEKVARARESLAAAVDVVTYVRTRQRKAAELRAVAEAEERQAAELEATLAATVAPRIAPEAFVAARGAAEKTHHHHVLAVNIRKAREAERTTEEAWKTHAALALTAQQLDKTVKALTDDAPAELLAGANAIQGLMLDGDDILLDGTRVDAMSSAEQMRFAIRLAKRLNAKTRILIVDGLERIDDDQRAAFIKEATADAWQVIASRVTKGKLVLESIDASEGDDDGSL